MRRCSLLLAFLLGGCPSGDGELGDRCEANNDCSSSLQCLAGTCITRCQRAPECGDGYACDVNGYCTLASGQQGDACDKEAGCAPGLSCQINGEAKDPVTEQLLASCTMQNAGHPPGEDCAADAECRNGTCALGRCVDLCDEDRDCGGGLACMGIPRIDPAPAANRNLGMFDACLPSSGNLAWPIDIAAPSQRILIPIPERATALSLVMSVDDPNQLVGAIRVLDPAGALLLDTCRDDDPFACDPLRKLHDAEARSRAELGQSVLQIPTHPTALLQTGAYEVTVSSLRAIDQRLVTGSAIPKVTAVIKLDENVILDLHFHFLDLDEHPCAAQLGSTAFDAERAKQTAAFQDDFIGELRTIFAPGGVALGALSYQDVVGHPELDGLDVLDAPALLSLGKHTSGIDVFFVRTLSPVGIQAIGPNPGPPMSGTRQSGIVVGLDSLCYRSWTDLARLTAHELARYMGLFHNIEVERDRMGGVLDDNIDDTPDSRANLMFYSEFGGTTLTPSQSEILHRSPVLR